MKKQFMLSDGSTTLYADDLETVLEYLKTELEENLKETDEGLVFTFGLTSMTQEEIDEMEDFNGF